MVGKERVEVPTGWLRSGLAAIVKNPKSCVKTATDLNARLGAMRQQAQTLAAGPPAIDGSARSKLNSILARPEFRGVHGPTWLDRLAEHAREWLAEWTKRLGMKLAAHPTIVNFVFWTLLICGTAGLLVWMVRQLLQHRGTENIKSETPETHHLNSRQHLSQAREAAARGEYRDAIRLAYWAAIQRLEELGLWSVDPTRTHREYLRLVRSDQPQREPLAVLTKQFELAWYAAQPSSKDDFQTVIAELEKLGCA